MSKKHLTIIAEAFMNGDLKTSEKVAKECIHSMFKAMVNEDHEKSMSEEELKHYIKDLHSKAKDEHKEAFAKHLEAGECNDEAFDQAAKKHCTSKDKADGLIHKLEKLVGSKIDPKEYKKDKKEGETDSEAEKESKMKKGQVKEAHPHYAKQECSTCDGMGEVVKDPTVGPIECRTCHGKGYYPAERLDGETVHESVKKKMVDASEHDEDEDAEYEDSKPDWKHTLDPKDKEKADKKDVKESLKTDILNELSKLVLGQYVKDASKDASELGYVLGKSPPNRKEIRQKELKRQKGIDKAVDKLTKDKKNVKESTLVEGSPIESKIDHADYNGTVRKHKNGKYSFKHNSKSHKLEFHATKEESRAALARHDKDYGKVKESEEIKQDVLNELKASTLASYIRNAASDAADHAYITGETSRTDIKKSAFRKNAQKHEEKRHMGITKATKKLVKKAKE